MRKTLLLVVLSVWLVVPPAVAGESAPPNQGSLARQCQEAYHRQDLGFVLQNCPEEAWALARAQCERSDETISERYAAFCRAFKSGQAPIYGR
ncbi:MAG: hypothetical protein P4L70_01730 [Parasulfuritortus sp.]|nr:hypothetical protein [Parasulfuritortus sp.]